MIKTITPTATMPTKPSKISLSTSALSSGSKVAKSTAVAMLSTTPSPEPKLIATLAFVLVFKAAKSAIMIKSASKPSLISTSATSMALYPAFKSSASMPQIMPSKLALPALRFAAMLGKSLSILL